jgi:hypothetical protein
MIPVSLLRRVAILVASAAIGCHLAPAHAAGLKKTVLVTDARNPA